MAQDLLDALRPTASTWGPQPKKWIFRGQADAAWPLLPSAFRADVWAKFVPGRHHFEGGRHTLAEVDVWVACADQIDRAGLELPGDRQEWRHPHTIPNTLGNDWPSISLLSAIAILQHYGAPTRLLDWCRGGLTAAYFAVKDRALAVYGEKPRGVRYKSAFLAVWALDLEFVRNSWESADRAAEVSIVGAPYATNPNLHAQQGVFTLDRSEKPRALEDVIAARHAKGTSSVPAPLYKLMLPAREAPELMRLLALNGVNAASVYPGYGGAIEAVREERLHAATKRRGLARA